MATETPNIGLQVPLFNAANWNVPTNFNWNLIDLIFGGDFVVPALNVTTLVAGNLSALIAAGLSSATTSETPSTTVAGTTYTLTHSAIAVIMVTVNGLVARNGVDYSVSGATITFSPSIPTTAAVYAVYMHA